MKKYLGVCDRGFMWVYVVENGKRKKLKVNSAIETPPTWPRHAWGYRGTGPQQLAKDLLEDLRLNRDSFDAVFWLVSEKLKWGQEWEMTEEELISEVAKCRDAVTCKESQ